MADPIVPPEDIWLKNAQYVLDLVFSCFYPINQDSTSQSYQKKLLDGFGSNFFRYLFGQINIWDLYWICFLLFSFEEYRKLKETLNYENILPPKNKN
jgi:hypothetical protein